MVAKKSKGGRPTNAELSQKRLDAAKLARFEEQEAKRAKPVLADQNVTLWVWLTGLAVGFIASAVISFNGITAVASLVGLSFDWMRFLFFGIVEWMYLVFLIAYLIQESRAEKSSGAFWGMVYFGFVGVGGNAYHTLVFHEWAWLSPDMWVGVVLAISAPF